MLCRLCLKTSSNMLDIFETVGLELGVATVLKQHFWFEPKIDDISTNVCHPCWLKVLDFHNFYVSVKEAHQLLTETFALDKVEEKPNTIIYPPLELISIETDETNTYKTENEKNDDDDTTQHKYQSETEEEFILSENYSDKEMNDSVKNLLESDSSRAESLYHLRRSNRVKTTVAKDDGLTAKLPLSAAKKGRSNNAIVQQGNEDSPKKKKKKKSTTITATATKLKRGRGRPRTKCITSSVENAKGTATPTAANEPTDCSSEEKLRRSTEDLDVKIIKYMKLACDICSMEFENFTTMKRHITAEHKCNGYAVCCGRKFYKRVLLSDHIEKHINPDCYKCNECDKVFADKQCLRNHELIKHQPEHAKTFLCAHCPKKFAKAYLLEQHRSLHDDRTHTCDLCQKNFSTLNSLRTHVKVIHENYGTMCDICAKVIRGRALFLRHQLQHSGVSIPKVQCDECGSWHKDKYSLQKHKRRHNESGIPHTCNICGKVSPNRSAMLSHQRYVHAAQRIFECGVCSKSFKKAIALREHMTMHTGEVLYNCPHCTKTFNSNANMHSHRKKVHPKEFEEARRNRRENAAKPTMPPNNENDGEVDEEGNEHNNHSQEQKGNSAKSASISSLTSHLITISTNDESGETHNILVTSGDFNEDDAEADSIIFTVQ